MTSNIVRVDREPAESAESSRTVGWESLASLTLATIAVAAWVWGVGQSDLAGMTDLGLVSVLAPAIWLAVMSSTLAFTVAVRTRRFSTPVASVALLTMLMVLYATPAAIERTPRMEATYRHLGIINHIATTGTADQRIDAYFNWPGFFAVTAFFKDITGTADLVPLATFAPFLATVLYLPPLLLVMRAISTSHRVQWLGVTIFYLANWTGQDYFAPQTFTFWIFLAVIGILLSVVPPGGTDPTGRMGRVRKLAQLDPPLAPGREGRIRLTPNDHRWLLGLVLAAAGASVASHQLTPYMLVVALGALWMAGRIRHWGLPIAVGLLAIGWLGGPARPYFAGHVADVLTVGGTGGSLIQRMVNGSPAHVAVVAARVAESGVVWLLAVLGAWTLWRRGCGIVVPLLLLAAPFTLLPLQPYGGEMVIRVFLFGLPFASCLVAVVLAPLCVRASWRRGSALFAILAILMATTLLTRYGNERGESFRPGELDAMEWIYDQNDSRATVIALTNTTPWRFRHYATWDYRAVQEAEPGKPWVASPTVWSVQAEIREPTPVPVFVVYTRSQSSMAELVNNGDSGITDLLGELRRDPRFAVEYQSHDATVLRWSGSRQRHPASNRDNVPIGVINAGR